MAGPHDVGGQAAGPVDRAEHDAALWEKEADAIQVLLSDESRRIVDVDEFRCGIESLGPDAYDTMSYYERWIASALVGKKILSEAEIAERVAAIRARRDHPVSARFAPEMLCGSRPETRRTTFARPII